MKLENLAIDDTLTITELKVPETVINDVTFSELDLKNLKVKVIDDYKGNKLCLFDKILFNSQINDKDCNWENSALCKYLSTVFNKSLEDVFECEVITNLLTEYELFGEDKQKSNYPIYPKRLKLDKDKIAFDYDTDKNLWYWLGNKSSRFPARFCSVRSDGYSYYHSYGSAGGVRPAFLLISNQNRFSGSSIDIAKQNKILEIQKTGINALYQLNGISDYKLDLFVDNFIIEVKGQKFLFDYENYRNPENIEKLKNIQNQKIVIIKKNNEESLKNIKQIEKMKFCENCKYRYWSEDRQKYCCEKTELWCENKKWELIDEE